MYARNRLWKVFFLKFSFVYADSFDRVLAVPRASSYQNVSRPSNAIQKALIFSNSSKNNVNSLLFAMKSVSMGQEDSSDWKQYVRTLEATQNGSQQVSVDYSTLMASIEDGQNRWGLPDPEEAHQYDALPPDYNNEALSKAIKPLDFFVFSCLLPWTGGTHVLKMHRQSKSAPYWEGNFMSMKNATLNFSNLNQMYYLCSQVQIEFPSHRCHADDITLFTSRQWTTPTPDTWK